MKALLLLCILGLAVIVFDLSRRFMKPSDALKITSPHNGAFVGYRHTITGVTNVPDTPVQVLIYSHDQKWYKQEPAVVDGSNWSLEAVFGEEGSRGHYIILAVAGSMKLSPAEDIPANVQRSKFVRVQRGRKGQA